MIAVRATLIELAKRVIKYDNKLKVHFNGADNNYPERVERIINNSATAKPAASLLKKYIIGKGFEGESAINDFIVNKEKGIILRDLLAKVAQSFAYQKGVAIHENFNLKLETISLDVLPFGHCRVGKKDDKKYNSKIGISDKWSNVEGDKIKLKEDDIELINVHNEKEVVRKDQIKNAGGVDKYKGQVHFFHPDETIYPLSHIDSALLDADSEYQASVFKNTSLRKGFFGKDIFVTKPLIGDIGPKSQLSEDELSQLKEAENGRDQFKKVLQSFMGAQNVDGAMHMEVEHDGDDLDKVFKHVKIDTNINDKLFEYTENSSANNIRKAFQNIPSILIENNDGSIFGQSGEMLKQAKLFYSEQTADEREYLESELYKLMKNFKDFPMPENGLKIIPLVNTEAHADNQV